MSEPTTEAGRALLPIGTPGDGPVLVRDGRTLLRAILLIETEAAAQAAAQERERLRADIWDIIKRPDAAMPIRTMDALIDALAEPVP